MQELARGWKKDPDTLPILKRFATSDGDSNVRLTAMKELVRGWKEDPEILVILKQLVTSDEDLVVRFGTVTVQIARPTSAKPCRAATSTPPQGPIAQSPAEHKTQVSQDTDKRYFGCKLSAGQITEITHPQDCRPCAVCRTFERDYLFLEGPLNRMALALHNLSRFQMSRLRAHKSNLIWLKDRLVFI